MLYTAVSLGKPVAVRYPRGTALGVPLTPLKKLEVARAEEIIPGKDVVLLAIGAMVAPALAAQEILGQKGINAGVVNARFIKPLDVATIRRLAKDVGILVTIEDNVLAGGFGSAVLECINELGLNWVKLLRLGLPDQFIEQGCRTKLLAACGLDAHGIARTVEQFVKKQGVK